MWFFTACFEFDETHGTDLYNLLADCEISRIARVMKQFGHNTEELTLVVEYEVNQNIRIPDYRYIAECLLDIDKTDVHELEELLKVWRL